MESITSPEVLLQKPKQMNVSMLECQHVTMSECQHIRMSECQHVRMSECQHVRMSEYQHIRMSECQHVRMSECQHDRMSECQYVTALTIGNCYRKVKRLFNIPQSTHSILMSYIYGAPSKARNLTSYIYGRDFLLRNLLLEPCISLIYA
jgi:hypothetical protein